MEVLGEVDSFIGSLLGGLFVEDDSRDVVLDSWGGEKHISVSSSVLFIVGKLDGIEFSID